jgi:hypothetical protein
MCYYSCIIFACQDWRWGDRQSYCRYGDEWENKPCGLKFSYDCKVNEELCEICIEQNIVSSRRKAEVGRYKRWEREWEVGKNHNNEEGDKLRETIENLDDTIRELQIRRVRELVERGQQTDHVAKKRKQDYNEWPPELADIMETNASDIPLFSVDFDELPSDIKVKCPYYLRHPQKHQKGSCMGPGFNKIGRLKYVVISISFHFSNRMQRAYRESPYEDLAVPKVLGRYGKLTCQR